MFNYYLVDTNIIISYLRNYSFLITKFIEDPNNKFFYTNTVKNEVEYYNESIPSIFKFVDTHLDQRRLDMAHQEIINHYPELQNKDKFHNDLCIIFEAGYICYSDKVLPSNDFTTPLLLTNNLFLYKKTKLEGIINLYGLEHLIDVVRPKDVIPGYI